MSVQGVLPGPQINPSAPSSKRELGKDEFLLLLVTQLQNQDPLNPMSNEAFIAQTAQFTSLETLGKINNNIIKSNSVSEQMNGIFATSMIGKNATVSVNEVALTDGESTSIEFDIPTGSSVFVSIHDRFGTQIRQERISDVSGKYEYTWDGLNDNKNQANDGIYSVNVYAADSSGGNTKLSYTTTGLVTGVKPVDGVLALGNLKVLFSSVLEVKSVTS